MYFVFNFFPPFVDFNSTIESNPTVKYNSLSSNFFFKNSVRFERMIFFTDMFFFLVDMQEICFYYLALHSSVRILVISERVLIEELHEGSPKSSLPCLT